MGDNKVCKLRLTIVHLKRSKKKVPFDHGPILEYEVEISVFFFFLFQRKMASIELYNKM